MRFRLLLLETLVMAVAAADPLTIIVSGTASGQLGTTSFVSSTFTFIVTTDTRFLKTETTDGIIDTPRGSPATFSIDGVGSGTFMDDQHIFVDPERFPQFSGGGIGFRHFQSAVLVALGSPQLVGYNLDRSIGPLTGTPLFFSTGTSFMSTAGPLSFSSVNPVSFTVVLNPAPPPVAPSITGIALPAGNAGASPAPGVPLLITGANLGTGASDVASLTIGGKAAPVISFLSPTALLAQVPVDFPVGATTVTATYKGQSSARFNLTVDAFSPAIYTTAPVFTGSGGTPVSATQPAVPGSTVSCVAIGLGATNPPMVTGAKATTKAPTTTPVQAMAGNKMVLPEYAGLLAGSITDYLVTFKVPLDVPAGNQPVTISVGGVTSNSVTLQVAPPVPAIGGVVSASAFGGSTSVAPGSWVEIYGSNLADHTRQWAGSDFSGINAPTMLDGVQVTIGGQKAFVDFISSGQVNAQLPSSISAGETQIAVTSGNITSAPFNIMVNATQPGMLAPPSFKIGGNQYVVAQFSDGTYVLPAGAIPGVTSRPAAPGETIVIYGIGFGSVTPNIPAGQIVTQANQLSLPLQIFFGQTQAQAPYFGLAPNFVGLYQFNVVVPAVTNNDLVPLTFNLGGLAGAQTLYIAVRQ